MKKYKLTKKSIEVFEKKLFQIKSLKEFGDVEKGELGGYIEKEQNLSQQSNAWVFDDAWVFGDAWVSDDARVFDDAWVSGELKLKLGFYFGMQYKKEELLKLKTKDNNYILWKR